MAGKAQNIKVYTPQKMHIGLTGNYYAICHYSYNYLSMANLKNNVKTENRFE